MSTEISPETDRWTPTATSTVIAATVTLGMVAALLWQVRLVLVPALIGSTGAVCFAGSLWLIDRDRYETVTAVLTSLLSVPIAIGVFVGTLGTVLLLVGAFFPVDTISLVAIRSLLLVARVGLVAGCVFAILGVTLGIRNVADTDSLADHYWLTVKTGLVPAAAGLVMSASTVLSKGVLPAAGEDVVVSTLFDLGAFLFGPGPIRTHLATVLVLVALAAATTRRAVEALPLAELLADRGIGQTHERRVAEARSYLSQVATVATLGGVLAFVVELAVPPLELRQLVGPDLYGLLVTLSTATIGRALLVWLTVLSIVIVGIVVVFRRIARGSLSGFTRQIGPFLGGVVATAGAIAFAGPVVDGLIDWIGTQLPTTFGELFREASTSVVEFYGQPTVMVVITAVLVTTTAVASLALRLTLAAGYLTEETAGFSLAAGGLFVAAAFAGTAGTDRVLVFAGLVASLLVWDVGRYGTTLGREIGSHARTRNAELVHAGGTLAVGVVGVLLALGLGAVFETPSVTVSAPTVAALVGVLVGIVLLIAALR
ncbi:MAG: hypothetical protein ACI8XM_000409 [Haloarculaceae archaeon]|jgi:hypothetical protein